MTTSYTSLLGLALPVTGELQGTWGDTVNNSITQLCEDAIAGVATASVTSADWTLTTTGSGAANQARMAILIPTGTPGVSRNIIAPSKSKTYTIINQSNASVVIKGASTTGVSVPAGAMADVAWNGSDFVDSTATRLASPIATIASTLLTTPVAGELEFDGSNAYFTNDTVSGRGVIPDYQIYKMTSNGTTFGTSITDYFPANSTITLVANTFYEVEYYLVYYRSTAATTFTITSNNSWTRASFLLTGSLDNGGSAIAQAVVAGAVSNANLYISASGTSNGVYSIKGVVFTGSSNQTLRLRLTNTAVSQALAGSYYKVTKIPSSNVGTFVA